MLTCTLAIAPCQHCPQAQLLRAPRLGSLVRTSDTEGPIAMLASELSLAPDRYRLVDRSIQCCRDHLGQGALGCGSPTSVERCHEFADERCSARRPSLLRNPGHIGQQLRRPPELGPGRQGVRSASSRIDALSVSGRERGRHMSPHATRASIASRTSHVLTSRGQRYGACGHRSCPPAVVGVRYAE